jgi:hypothetical protein
VALVRETNEASPLPFNAPLVLKSSLPDSIKTALRNAPAADQVDDEYDDCDYQQQVNQASGYMEAKAEQPQN